MSPCIQSLADGVLRRVAVLIPLLSSMLILGVGAASADMLEPGNIADLNGSSPLAEWGALGVMPDGHGRLWAPVMINGKGPFHLIVDSGANRSTVTPAVARVLGAGSPAVQPVHGVTGNSLVPMVNIGSMSAGPWRLPNVALPVLSSAVAREDGFLGLAGAGAGRIMLDLDRRELRVEEPEATLPLFDRIPAKRAPGGLLMVEVRVGRVVAQAILDTGAEATIGNTALQKSLGIERARVGSLDRIVGAGDAEQRGQTTSIPPFTMGNVRIEGAPVSFGNLPIFEYFGLGGTPAMLLGMDVIGSLSAVVFDYTHSSILIRPRKRG